MSKNKKMISVLLSIQDIEMLSKLKTETQFSVTTLIRLAIKLLKRKYKQSNIL